MSKSIAETSSSEGEKSKTFYVSKEEYENLNIENPILEMFSVLTDDDEVKGHIITTLE